MNDNQAISVAITKLQQEVLAKEAENETMRDRLQVLEAMREALRLESPNLVAKAVALRARVEALEAGNGTWARDCAVLREKLGRKDARVEELEGLADTLKQRGDDAYCQMIEQARKDECLGWEIKVKNGTFGQAELGAHAKCGEMLGRHRALVEAYQLWKYIPTPSGAGEEDNGAL